jgi:hypothetical protein
MRGFALVETREESGFKNILLRFQGEYCEVRAVRERGTWRVGIAPPGGVPDMAPKIWACYIEGIDPDPLQGADPLEADIAFVYERLDEVESAARRDKEIGERLREINWKIVAVRLGFDRDTPPPGKPGFADAANRFLRERP